MTALVRHPVHRALTRPQMFAGVTYNYFIINGMVTTEAFLITGSWLSLLVFAVIILLVSAFLIYNVFSITLGQRIKELGLLRAVGAFGSQVTNMMLGPERGFGAGFESYDPAFDVRDARATSEAALARLGAASRSRPLFGDSPGRPCGSSRNSSEHRRRRVPSRRGQSRNHLSASTRRAVRVPCLYSLTRPTLMGAWSFSSGCAKRWACPFSARTF